MTVTQLSGGPVYTDPGGQTVLPCYAETELLADAEAWFVVTALYGTQIRRVSRRHCAVYKINLLTYLLFTNWNGTKMIARPHLPFSVAEL